MTAYQGGAWNMPPRVLIVGAGLGGLTSAMTLSAAGARVTLLERAAHPGGKARALDSVAGPVNAGPTVLTMRHVFDDVFRRTGVSLDDRVQLTAEHLLARHWWPDGSTLDLHRDRAASEQAIRDFAGGRAAQQFTKFATNAQALFDAFQTPVMETSAPSYVTMVGHVMRRPRLAKLIAPHKTYAKMLDGSFDDPRLRQLFGRYATYVGGSPLKSPAILSLIWRAEEAGVWRVNGGVSTLAKAMATRVEELGGEIVYGCDIVEIRATEGAVRSASGEKWKGAAVLYAGDPASLQGGDLGATTVKAVTKDAVTPRSLSANVWAFAATPTGADLTHHNVFFADRPNSEFEDMDRGRTPDDPTIYLCAQDRGAGETPPDIERFEIITNAPPTARTSTPSNEAKQECQVLISQRLARFGLTFSPKPGIDALTTPPDFARLFPGSAGSLYGLSPHDLNATFRRPTARSRLKGLYLAGGGAHPGPGAPMATLSGLRAAEAIATDLALTSQSRRMAMPGGT